MTSTTGAQPHVSGLIGAPEWRLLVKARTAATPTAALVGRSFTAGRAYDRASGPSARRALLREFVAPR